MDNLNLKAIILAVVLLVFTYSYYAGERGSTLSIWVPIIFGLIGLVMLVVYFFAIKLTGYLITTEIYPNIGLRILLPFFTFTIPVWVIFAFITVKSFGNLSDFLRVFKLFATKHMLFIGICTVIIGLTYSYPAGKLETANQVLLKKNLLFLAIAIAVFLLFIYLFFIAFKIKQPNLADKYLQYKNLDQPQSSENFEVAHLLSAEEYKYLAVPYFLPNKDEVIIVSTYGSNNKNKPVYTIYRLNLNGDIIETLNDDKDLRNGNLYPLIMVDGILLDEDRGDDVVTWIFDGNKNRKPSGSLKLNKNWLIDTLIADKELIQMVHFQKNAKFECGNMNEVKYNGDKYYEVKKGNDLLKFKVDSVYSSSDELGNCQEKTLDYYTSEKMKFSLIRLDNKQYYIIKSKKK
ncbi:MAG: hypothetical protein EOO47_01630 [Flavobacterium sp.]|nr:MAG: hypothetical protein EOO47_01630 [Flavobacterium sp.]